MVRAKTGEPTPFEARWGITAKELAKSENTTIDALHMRSMNYGSPFQRKKSPSYWENKYGRSMAELSEMLNLHPMSIKGRERDNGNIFTVTDRASKLVAGRGEQQSYDTTIRSRNKFWLHPDHPDYQTERAKLEAYING